MDAKDTRVCASCSQEKPVSDFYPRNKSCKECILTTRKVRRKQQKEERQRIKAQKSASHPSFDITWSKVCKKCGHQKSKKAFYNSGLTCKECTKAEYREMRIAKKEKERSDYSDMLLSMPYHERVAFLERKRRESHYREKYGLTLARLEEMYKQQRGKCAICCQSYHVEELYVDHDHTIGIVRGLLCHGCNTGIGMLKDSPEFLLNAAKYLTSFKNGMEGWAPNHEGAS